MSNLTSSPDKSGEITARLEAVTEGPWGIYLDTTKDYTCYAVSSGDGPRYNMGGGDLDTGYGLIEEHAEFIAHAPSDITFLLGRVNELEAQRDAVLAIHRRGMIYTSGSTDPKHKPSTEFRCTDDHLLWPCPSAQALGVTS